MTHKQFAELVAEMRAAQKFYSNKPDTIVKIVLLESEVDAALVVMEKPCEHPHQKWEGRPPKKICQDCGEWVE